MVKGKKKEAEAPGAGDPKPKRVSKAKAALRKEAQTLQVEVEKHDRLLQEMRARIETARIKGPEGLRATATKSKAELNKQERQVERDKALAKRRKLEIEEWQQWYQQQPPDAQGAQWAKLEYEVRWRLDEIGELEERIAGGEQARLQAFWEAEAAQQDLIALGSGLGESPADEAPGRDLIALESGPGENLLDEDPRIKVIIRGRQAAASNLEAAEAKIRRAK